MAKTKTVKAVETVRPEVTRVLPEKYFETSYQGPLSSFDKYKLYNVSALMTCRGPSANSSRFQPIKLSASLIVSRSLEQLTLESKEYEESKVVRPLSRIGNMLEETEMVI